ncbi:hypothetical protein V6Z11_D13G240100 [Gossypium hirsutum]|uniref:Disease resistance protein RGA2-like n=1 Tax=Gossypium hirsutum TaxID=3635 RepID=A0A1U8LY32_GOSHI|nr:disease resistance protein RGA2-like [Gossypium hirsutum]XP_016719437.1 disease resistance protein RGA2-like [Gossypium hirsutum]
MAETFLFNIADRVLAKIGNLSVDEVRLAFNVKTDLKKLEDTMFSIKAVLLDAERQQHQNEKLRLCMWKLRDIFYDAENVIDDFKCEALRKQDAINHPDINNLKVRVLGSCCLPLSFSLKMSHKIKDINGRLGELATEWKSFDLRQCSDNRHVFRRETISFVDSSDVIGRDEDKENIISMLMKPSEARNVPVIPIVGIGGLGKTTLAQLVYNDDRVTSLFPLKIWICVSEEFDLSRLVRLIIQSVNKGERCDDSTLDALQARLRSLLTEKKFLLILDDVWNENKAKWVELINLLRSTDGFSPSKIIVTTRSLNVASIMSSIPPYILKGLPLEATHLKEIRAGFWTSLQYLELRCCMELECLREGMQYLKSLRTLVVSSCVKLVSLPRSLKFLAKLEDLIIVMCHLINLKMEPEEEEDKDLQLSLKTLSLFGLDALRDLPRLLLQGSSSTLQQLRIVFCPKLSVLPAWLPNLTSLQKLEIVNCRNLSALPEGIDRLTNLRELTIQRCPELSKRYRENGGEDWHKIAHIQKVIIKDED